MLGALINMKLFSLDKKNKISNIKSKPFGLEKDIQDIVEQNTKSLFDLEFYTAYACSTRAKGVGSLHEAWLAPVKIASL